MTSGRDVLVKHFYDYYNCYRDHAERRADAAISALAEAGFEIAKIDETLEFWEF